MTPVALLAGVVCAFVGCTLAGRLATAHNCFTDFQRFHQAISLAGLVYPTASQVRALGRERLDRERIAVIVGGSSVLRGYGQGPEQIWTRHLQEELGDGYRVLNLAMDEGYPAEFGGTAAEILARDFPRLLFVSCLTFQCGVARPPLSPDVRAAAVPQGNRYDYFFWDAYYKGLLPTDAARAGAVAAVARQRGEDSHFAELLRGLRLDSVVFSRDLWTTLACSHLCTVWAPPPSPSPFFRPRGRISETRRSAAVPSLETQLHGSPASVDFLRAALRSEVQAGRLLLDHAGDPLRVDASPFLLFPPSLRQRTLLLPTRWNPACVAAFCPRAQSAYRAAFPVFVRALERAGFAALEVEAGYSAGDFVDHCHLAESGGRKLAAEVAPAVRRLARRLGY